MSGAMTGIITSYYDDDSPIITIVEPDRADFAMSVPEAVAANGADNA